MNPLVLVVDGDPDTLDLVTLCFERERFLVRTAFTGARAVKEMNRTIPDLVILDLNLPGKEGFHVLEFLRSQKKTAYVPVLILSARGSLADRIAGLEQGGSDYVVKPFSSRELILRARALIRRSNTTDDAQAPFQLEQNTLSVSLDGNRVYLSGTEFKLLKALTSREGQIVLREQLLKQIWGRSLDNDSRALDAHVMRLRKKLDNYSDCIDTIRGVGYRFTFRPANSALDQPG